MNTGTTYTLFVYSAVFGTNFGGLLSEDNQDVDR